LILDGKVVAQKVLDEVRAGVARFRDTTGVAPKLAVVLVGDFAPSKIYIANKKRAADTVGIAAEDHLHPEGPASTASCCSFRCRPGSTRTRRSPRSIPRRTSMACIPSTSGGCSRAPRRSCRARPGAAWRFSTITGAS
jgi:hypothetical protein